MIESGLPEREQLRRKRIRESDIMVELPLLNDAFEKELKRQREEGIPAVDIAAYERIRTNPPQTFEEHDDFEKEFPDCKGEFIWGCRARIYREKYGIWI